LFKKKIKNSLDRCTANLNKTSSLFYCSEVKQTVSHYILQSIYKRTGHMLTFLKKRELNRQTNARA